MPRGSNIVDRPDLRGRTRVFSSFAAAGELLAAMLRRYREDDVLILTTGCCGAAVAAPIARALNLPVDVAPAIPIAAPTDPRAVLGAVAWDGTVYLDDEAIGRQQLLESQVDQVVERAREAAAAARAAIAGEHAMPDLMRRTILLVGDGLAADATVRALMRSLATAEAARVLVAMPTGHAGALARVAEEAFAVYCLNLRDGEGFSVAEAYEDYAEPTPEAARELIAPFLPPTVA